MNRASIAALKAVRDQLEEICSRAMEATARAVADERLACEALAAFDRAITEMERGK